MAIDQRGYSLSDKPKGRYNYTKSKLISDVAEVIDALGMSLNFLLFKINLHTHTELLIFY